MFPLIGHFFLILSSHWSELPHNVHIQSLILQADKAAPHLNALVPTHHCLHTPGGALKFSLEVMTIISSARTPQMFLTELVLALRIEPKNL